VAATLEQEISVGSVRKTVQLLTYLLTQLSPS
jgi:hypothetical protein